jgi:hypothetical protein
MLDALPWKLTVSEAGLDRAAAQASAEDGSKRARAILFAISFPHFWVWVPRSMAKKRVGGHTHPWISLEERGSAIECLHLMLCHYRFRPSAVLYLH